MKTSKIFLGDMTDREVKNFLEKCQRVVVPVGSTEQHGPHLPLNTDAIIANEVARRVSLKIGALVAPRVNYGISYEHKGLSVVPISVGTLMNLLSEICVSLAETGFKRIVLLNGHWTNDAMLFYACQKAHQELPQGALAFPISYWKALSGTELSAYLSLESGLHANIGETSAILAIDSDLVDMERAVEEWPEFSGIASDPLTVGACLFHIDSSLTKMTKSGVWGNPKEATKDKGEKFLQIITERVIKLILDVEETYSKLLR